MHVWRNDWKQLNCCDLNVVDRRSPVCRSPNELTEQIYFVGGNHFSRWRSSLFICATFAFNISFGNHRYCCCRFSFALTLALALSVSFSLSVHCLSWHLVGFCCCLLPMSTHTHTHTFGILFASRFQMGTVDGMTWMLLTDDNNSRAYYYFYKEVHKNYCHHQMICGAYCQFCQSNQAIVELCVYRQRKVEASEWIVTYAESTKKNTTTALCRKERQNKQAFVHVFMIQSHSLTFIWRSVCLAANICVSCSVLNCEWFCEALHTAKVIEPLVLFPFYHSRSFTVKRPDRRLCLLMCVCVNVYCHFGCYCCAPFSDTLHFI